MTRFSMQYGTQTRKSASGQPFDEDYQIWLAGYWEDFTGAYSLPEATSNDLTHTNTHYGNPMNAEARLNPHYRWSYPDRIATYSGSTIYGGQVTNDMNLLHNLSMAEWLSIDPTRLGKGRDYVSKINNEYPDSHAHSNRFRFGGKGELDNHLSITGSHTASGHYLISNGNIDSSFGRSSMVRYDFDANAGLPSQLGAAGPVDGGEETYFEVDVSAEYNENGDDTKVHHTASAVTCGVFTTDTTQADILTTSSWSASQHAAHILGAEIKSPSRSPFLAIRHTMPATTRLQGDVDHTGTDGEWRYTGAKRELAHLRVGDIVQVGKHDEFCVIQEFVGDSGENGRISKLYSLSRNQLLNVSKFDSGSGDYISGGATANNVDIRKWFEPVITYDGDLNCVGDGDTFHLRFCPLATNQYGLPDDNRVAHYILRVGFDSTRLNITSNGNRYDLLGSDYHPSHSKAAIEVELQLHPTTESQKIDHGINQVRISTLDTSIRTDHKQAFIDYDATSTVTAPNYTNEWEHWVDVDVVMDFTNQRYKVYVDGYEAGTFNFETKPSTGNWAATDLFGWHLDHAALQKDGEYTPDNAVNEYALSAGKFWGPEARRTANLYTLIDRVGVVNEITNPVRNSPNTISSASDIGVGDISLRQGLNMTSRLEVLLHDDDNERQIQDIFINYPSEWMVLFFNNGIDSPHWTGFLEAIKVEQKKSSKTRDIKITARDCLGKMDGIMPYWEVGQEETTAPSTTYTYRREESLSMSENFYLGARALLRGAETIGMDHQTRAAHPQASTTEIGAIQGYYAARYDQRTRLYSGNPIQMYVGQDYYGPSVDPDIYNTTATPQDADKNIWRMWSSKKIIGFSDGSFHGGKYITAHCIEHGLAVDDEFVIYGEPVANAFTVQAGATDDGLTIVVKKILDDNHFCFEYKSTVGSIFGRLGDEPGHFWSVVTRDDDNFGLGLKLPSGTVEAAMQFSNNHQRGLSAIQDPEHSISAMYRVDAIDGRQWRCGYTDVAWTLGGSSGGVGGGAWSANYSPVVVDSDFNSDGTNDSRICNALSKGMSIPSAGQGAPSTGVVNVEIATNQHGFASYDFRPAGLIRLEDGNLSYISEDALITVGPRGSFPKGDQLISSAPLYNKSAALEYLNWGSATERSQIMTMIDAYKEFHMTQLVALGGGIGSGSFFVGGNTNTHPTLLVRGNDIDQIDPKNISSSAVTTHINYPQQGRAPVFAKWTNAKTTTVSASGSGPWEITLPSAGFKLIPYSGIATIDTGTPAASLIRWTGKNEGANKLTGVTILTAGTAGIVSGGGQAFNPKFFPLVCSAQAVFTHPNPPREQYRMAHASYMHDIASSPWFRMVFGIIESYAAGTHGPPHWASAQTGNKTISGPGWGAGWYNIDGEWVSEASLQLGDLTGVGELTTATQIYGESSQYSDTFTLTADYDPATDTSFTISDGTPPLIDENMKDRRWIDKGSRVDDHGTDPTISIPSRAWAPSAKQAMNNGCLVFEIENTDGSIDVGAARSARMTTCIETTESGKTHWEISRIRQSEIQNTLVNGEWGVLGASPDQVMPGPIWLWAAQDPDDWVSAAETLNDYNDLKDEDFFHSGDPDAVSGARLFTSLSVGDIIFVGNTQGKLSNTTPVTNEVNEVFNPNNPLGEDRDLVSYRWYRVIDKRDDERAIAIFPAEYAYSNHILDIQHPVGMGITTEQGSSSFTGWKHKLVRSTGTTNPFNANQPSGFPNTNKAICKVYGGNIQVSGVKHLINKHLAGTKGRFRYIRNDFNHIWLNWADMRNDGSADADGGHREDSFGLIYPTDSEYNVDLVFSLTQENITTMKIGSDVDLWELTDTDPFTSAAWSANYSGKQNLTHLQSWESKAGAPMLCDLSKFFNLNTMANNGRIGQDSGGTKVITDYEISSAGEAILLDNYWWQAGPTPYTAKYRYPYDPNYRFYVRYKTKLIQSMSKYPLMVIDSSKVYQGAFFPEFRNAGIMEFKKETGDELDTFTYKMGGCFVSDYDESLSVDAVRLYLDLGTKKIEDDEIGVTIANTEHYETDATYGLSPEREHTVFSSWAAPSSLGAMLVMEGHVASKGSNTYYHEDQIRLTWQSHRVQCWLSGTEIPCNYDINNVPIAYKMDYGQQGGSSSIDSFGSIFDGRGKTTLGIIRGMKDSSGDGDLGTYNAFNYMIGRNNRFEFRPTYGSGLTIDRSILSRSDVSSEARGQFTHVRAIYNGGASFVDVPTPILDGSSARFKILPLLNVASSKEAESTATRELNRINDSAVAVDCELIGDQTNLNASLDGGLFGYICTPLVQNHAGVATNNHGALIHSGNLGGQIIGGRQNAMDGNLDATNGSHIGSQRSMEYLESGRGYHGGGGCNTYDTHETDFSGQFIPYGICSIEKAVQVVHIPKGVPKVSDTTGQKLRIFITHNSDVANEGKFRIWLIDSHFDSQRRQDDSNDLSAAKIAYVDVEANGFIEIPFPTSYGAGSLKMVISFNREYCIDLLKYRSNNSTESKSNKGNRVTTLAHTPVQILDLTSNSSVNEASAFPLGLPLFYRPFGSEDSQGRQGPLWQVRPRSLYYAPQIEIVDDFVWRPGRTVTYTDAMLNLNENLTIMEVEWQQRGQGIETTKLKLKKDESQGISMYGLGGQMPKPIPPGRPPEDDGGSPIGGIPGQPPVRPGDDFRDDWAPGWGGLIPPDRGGIGGDHTISPLKTSNARQHSISGAPDQQGGAGSGATMSGGKVSINKLSKSASNILKGGGDIIAPRRPKNQKKVTSKEAIGQTKATGSGSAMLGASGFTLPGVSQVPDGGIGQADYHEGSVIITVPQAVSSNTIKVLANVIAPSTGGGTKYTLFTSLECIETGFKQRKYVDITANDTSQRVTIFSARGVEGADTLGNRIRVTLGRVPGGGSMTNPDGSDDSPLASLIVKGVEVVFNENAEDKQIGRLTSQDRLTHQDNTKGWMTETDDGWKSGTSDGDFDSAGDISYSRRGRPGSNALRKPDGSGGYIEDSLG